MRRVALRVLILGFVIWVGWLAWLAVDEVRFQARRDLSRMHLKNIGLALHLYHDMHGRFPPAYQLGPDGQPWHSWRVSLLPFLGQEKLYEQYRFDEPWDGPHNRELIRSIPPEYTSGLGQSRKPGVTTFLAIVSRRTMWPAHFSLGIADVTDGTSNTLFVLEDVRSDVLWTEPRDLRESSALGLFGHASASNRDEIHCLFVDGAARSLRPSINRQLLVSLMTPQFGKSAIADDRWPAGLLAGGRPRAFQWPEPKRPGDLPATALTPIPGTPLVPHRNALYCATIQLAWDLLRPSPEAPVVVGPPTAVTDELNRHPFPLSALSPESYYVFSGRWDTGQDAEMQRQFRERFPNAPVVFATPPPVSGVRIFAYLQKSLPFPEVLQLHPQPLRFQTNEQTRPVASFGWQPVEKDGADMEVLQQTVTIRDYVSDDDFIIEFRTDTPEADEILVAKVPAAATLRETWEAVERRLQQPPSSSLKPRLLAIEPLQVPILTCSLTTEFSELAGVGVPLPTNALRYIDSAGQTLRFRLDEYGAELISDSYLMVADNGHGPESFIRRDPPKPRRFIVDRPYLLALRQHGAPVPYFLGWIANADLMEPHSSALVEAQPGRMP